MTHRALYHVCGGLDGSRGAGRFPLEAVGGVNSTTDDELEVFGHGEGADPLLKVRVGGGHA